MKQNKLIWAGALLAAAVLFSASCGKTGGTRRASTAGEATEAPAGTVDTTPETEDPIDYDALGRIPFANLKASAESDFTVEEGADGVTVTAYVGAGEQVRIPDRIGAKAGCRDRATAHFAEFPA